MKTRNLNNVIPKEMINRDPSNGGNKKRIQ